LTKSLIDCACFDHCLVIAAARLSLSLQQPPQFKKQHGEPLMQLKDKAFLVSGGASGLGAATARMLVEAGARVMLVDLNAEAVAAQAGQFGGQAAFHAGDITQEAVAQGAVDAAVKAFGHLHGLVNCAGIGGAEKILGKEQPHRLESFSRIINVNLIGSFNLLRLAAEAMANNEPNGEGERGVVINTASIAAYDGQIGQAAYAASKGAIVSLTLPAARELARFGIRVMTIAPGIFETPMMAGVAEPVREALAVGVPFPPRLGKPDEYAALVRHIVENSMLNGEVIRLDGALRMAAK
jgi:NAD(P)-dependent dehydrogenase (short-subunit alcohol dehydrogenase family)